MKWLPAVRVLFSVKVFVGLQTRIFGIAELTGLLVGKRITRLEPFAAVGTFTRSHNTSIPPKESLA
jgi:hypothetical protein